MPMVVTDPCLPDNPIVFVNPAFIQMTGYPEDEILGRNCRFLQGADTDRTIIGDLRDAIANRREIAVEVLNYRKDGSAFWNALFMSPVYDKSGTLVYFFGSQLDVSRRRDAEESLRQSQKMEAVGQLTGGIAHDFNNLLQVILGFTDTLKSRLTPEGDPKVIRALDAIEQAGTRGATLTQQLLAFARKQRLDGRAVNVNALIQGLEPLIERTLGAGVAIETRLAPALENSKLDAVQAELAILNILINARDAMNGSGKIVVETSMRDIDEEDRRQFNELEPGRYVGLSITDSGEGMPPEVVKRALEPFFTTKEQGKGTGLGLSMVYGFAKQSGGAVRIYSEVGHGTTIRLYFPAIGASSTPRGSAGSKLRDEKSGSEVVLIVEDQADVAELAEAILSDFGYVTLLAGNAEEALQILDSAQHVDLLFSDLIMPGGMNGIMLAREARRRQPKLRILLTTGYAEASLERLDARGNEFDLISKPYRRSELATKVRQVIDGPTGVG